MVKTKSKKLLILTLLTVFIVTLLTGCGATHPKTPLSHKDFEKVMKDDKAEEIMKTTAKDAPELKDVIKVSTLYASPDAKDKGYMIDYTEYANKKQAEEFYKNAYDKITAQMEIVDKVKKKDIVTKKDEKDDNYKSTIVTDKKHKTYYRVIRHDDYTILIAAIKPLKADKDSTEYLKSVEELETKLGYPRPNLDK